MARVEQGELTIRRAPIEGADAIFRAPAATVMAALLYGGIPVKALEAEAGLVIEGNRDLALRYAVLFALPDKVG